MGRIALAVLLLSAAACHPFAGGKYRTFRSEDGRFRVTAPRSWNHRDDLDNAAEIQIADFRQGVCLIVDVERKADAEESGLDDYTERVRNRFVEPLRSSSVSPSREVSLEGMRGIESEIEGTVGRNRFAYLFVTVETGEHYAQLIAWTLQAHREENLHLIRSVAYSFREDR